MFGKVVSGFCRKRGGLVFVAGAIGLLASVEYLLAMRAPKPDRTPGSRLRNQSTHPTPRFKITQTRSELGYVYWVVRVVGGNPSYALFDTWREAMDEVNHRVKAAASRRLVPASDALLTAV
jgi:hypothetical protein